MRWILGVSAVAALSLASCQKAAERPPATTFVFDSAWVRPVVDSGATTAAYVSVTNGLPASVTISGFSSPSARTVELHESMTDAGHMMHMRPKADTTLAAGRSLVMRPNGLHLMLIGTTRPLTVGDTVRISMHLSNGSIVSTTANVRAP
jgi:periplasmic copper chaperone A